MAGKRFARNSLKKIINEVHYGKRVIANAYIYEELEGGKYRAISEDGDSFIMRSGYMAGGVVGDVGIISYIGDGATYGMHSFRPDKSVRIDFDKMVENYNHKWNANISI